MASYHIRPYCLWLLLACFAFASSGSYETSAVIAPPGGSPSTYNVAAESASGRFLQTPFGLGASYMLSRPVALCA